MSDYLEEVRKRLELPLAETEQVMRELSSHYSEVEEELVASGMNKAEALREAARRLGQPGVVAARLVAVHSLLR